MANKSLEDEKGLNRGKWRHNRNAKNNKIEKPTRCSNDCMAKKSLKGEKGLN